MHEIFDGLDVLGDEVSASQMIAEFNITSESEMNAQHWFSSNDDTGLNVQHQTEDAPVQKLLNEAIPDKSYERYVSAYDMFMRWQEKKQTHSFTESVLLDYFHEMAEKYKPSSLWNSYSLLKRTILCNHKVNISGYSRLIEFLKNKADGFQSKKSKLFTADDIKKFLFEAPDEEYLAMKTVLVFGMIGACSLDSIAYATTEHVKDNGNEVIVRVRDPKTKGAKGHIIGGQFAEIVRKYMRLRPPRANTDRFFMQYLNGKCTVQVIGKNKIAKMPKEIAKFLDLPEPETYTGNSFRRTSTTISTDNDVGIEIRYEPWVSSVESLGDERNIDTLTADEENSPFEGNANIGSHENVSERIAATTTDLSESNTENKDATLQDALKEAISGKSYNKYQNVYDTFVKWQEKNEANSFAESVLLDYFREISTKNKPSSLWAVYSMLKSTLLCNHDIKLSEYSQLIEFLKKNAEGFRSKKAKLFTADDINKFLLEAPDDKYLATKTILVFGLIGAFSTDSIVNVTTDHVKDNGNEIIARIPDPKTKVSKAHIIGGQFADIVRKYIKLRPPRASTDRFFMQFLNGKCHNQVIGKNRVSKMPKEIAEFLELPESEAYTGYSFRATSATISADTGVAVDILRRYGRRSNKVAEENVHESLGHNRKIDTLVAEEMNSPSTSNVVIASDTVTISEKPSFVYETFDESTVYIPENNSFPETEGYFQQCLEDKSKIRTLTAEEINSPFKWNVNIASHENVSERIAAATTTSCELSLVKQELTDPLENSSVSENEDKISYYNFKKSDPSIQEALKKAIPEKSYNKYVNAYEAFIEWKETNKINSFAEPVLLDYFREISTTYKPTSLWAVYSKLKPTLLCIDNINIAGYSRLLEFLKKISEGYHSKKAKLFTADDMNKFLFEAPDEKYLATKSILVFGLIGACSTNVLINIKVDHVKDNGNEIIARIPDPKTNVAKSHVIDGQYAEIVRKYIKLRPPSLNNQFFMHYVNGKCINQSIGKQSIIKMPKEIAEFLKLPESEAYTGFSFRRTSTTISADTGVAIEILKRNGQRTSNQVGEENVQESLGQKRKIDTLVAEDMNSPSTSNVIIASQENASKRIATEIVTNSESPSFEYEISDESTGYIPENNSLPGNEGYAQESLGDKNKIRTLTSEELNSPFKWNVNSASHENVSERIAAATTTSCASSSFKQYEKVATDPSENRTLSEYEGYAKESLGDRSKIRTLTAEEINSSATSNFVSVSHENVSERIAGTTATSCELSSLKQNEKVAAADSSEKSTLFENEGRCDSVDDTRLIIQHRTNVENFSCPPPLAYFKKSDESTQVAPNQSLPDHISGASTQEALKNLTDKSYRRYWYIYKLFIKWQQSKEVNSFAEPVLLQYFRELSKQYKPMSLRNIYVMLKGTILCNHKIDISRYSRLLDFLKLFREKFPSRKLKVFTAQEVNKFLIEAPDDEYLAMKAILVFGVIGASRGDHIPNVMNDYVSDNGNEIIVRIPHPKTEGTKLCVIDGQYAEILRKYMKLRPIPSSTDRFFVRYHNGECTDQAIGKQKNKRIPKEVAKFLKLPEPEDYSGYSFRITSTTTTSDDTGVGFETLNRHVQRRSSRVAERNVRESLEHQRIRALTAEEINSPSTSGFIYSSYGNVSERIDTITITSSDSSSFEQDERDDSTDISEKSSWSENEEPSDSNDDTGPEGYHRTKASRHKRRKRPKIQNEINWYDEECQSQIKLTTEMFKRSAHMDEEFKMQMLSDFSMHRVELFKKYFAEMNSTNTSTTAASTSTENGRMAGPEFEFVTVNSL